MNALYDLNPDYIGTKETFKQPDSVVTASFCGISGLAPSTSCENAGLVISDLFNKNVFLPTEPDDSFVSSTTVVIDGRSYAALPSTPAEFVENQGLGLNQAFIDRMLGKLGGDASKLLSFSSGNGVSTGAEFTADGVAPSAVSATLSNGTLSWSKSASNDVVGYRVYNLSNGGQLVASKKSYEDLHVNVSSGSQYIVVAVDITGLESAYSNEVGEIIVTPPPIEENLEQPEEIIEDPEPDPEPDPEFDFDDLFDDLEDE